MRMQIKLLYIADVNAKCYSHFEKNVWQFLINPKPPAPFYSAIPLQLFTHDANTGSHKHFQVNGHTASFTPKPQTEDNPIVLHGMQGQLLAGPFTGWLFHNKKILSGTDTCTTMDESWGEGWEADTKGFMLYYIIFSKRQIYRAKNRSVTVVGSGWSEGYEEIFFFFLHDENILYLKSSAHSSVYNYWES